MPSLTVMEQTRNLDTEELCLIVNLELHLHEHFQHLCPEIKFMGSGIEGADGNWVISAVFPEAYKSLIVMNHLTNIRNMASAFVAGWRRSHETMQTLLLTK